MKWTQSGGEASISTECQSRCKTRQMTNIYSIDSDGETIVDLVKDHEELYKETNVHFKDKTRKVSLSERFASSHKLSVKVC